MTPHTGHKKLIVILLILLILFIVGIYLSKRNVTITQSDTPVADGFSPFERPVNRIIDAQSPDEPWVDRPIPPAPVPEPPAVIREEPSVYVEPTPYQPAITRDAASFRIPENEPVPQYETQTYEQPYTGTIYYNTAPAYTPLSYATSTEAIANTQQQTEEKKENIIWTVLEVVGFFAGNPADFNRITERLVTGNLGRSTNPFGGGGGGGGGLGGIGGGGGGDGALTEFGGRVTRVTTCSCSGSNMIDIQDVRGQNLSLIYQPGASVLYANFNINGVGQNVLGNYTSGGSCLVYAGTGCTSQGSPSGTITQIGTSK